MLNKILLIYMYDIVLKILYHLFFLYDILEFEIIEKWLVIYLMKTEVLHLLL